MLDDDGIEPIKGRFDLVRQNLAPKLASGQPMPKSLQVIGERRDTMSHPMKVVRGDVKDQPIANSSSANNSKSSHKNSGG
jgi:hypothetical protein